MNPCWPLERFEILWHWLHFSDQEVNHLSLHLHLQQIGHKNCTDCATKSVWSMLLRALCLFVPVEYHVDVQEMTNRCIKVHKRSKVPLSISNKFDCLCITSTPRLMDSVREQMAFYLFFPADRILAAWWIESSAVSSDGEGRGKRWDLTVKPERRPDASLKQTRREAEGLNRAGSRCRKQLKIPLRGGRGGFT